MALLLGVLLNATNEAAVAVYLSLRAGRVRQDAINAAANIVLSGDYTKQLSHFSDQLRRNGTTLRTAVLVLWMLCRTVFCGWSFSTRQISCWTFGIRLNISTPTGPPIPTSQQERDRIHEGNLDRLFVYRKTDIEQLLGDITALWFTLGSFIYFLRNSRPQNVYDQLCNEPHVKTELLKIQST